MNKIILFCVIFYLESSIQSEVILTKDNPEVKLFVEKGLKKYLITLHNEYFIELEPEDIECWSLKNASVQVKNGRRKYEISVKYTIKEKAHHRFPKEHGLPKLECDITAESGSIEPLKLDCCEIYPKRILDARELLNFVVRASVWVDKQLNENNANNGQLL